MWGRGRLDGASPLLLRRVFTRSPTPPSSPACCPPSSTRSPRLRPRRPEEADRRIDGDWAALLLRRELKVCFPPMLPPSSSAPATSSRCSCTSSRSWSPSGRPSATRSSSRSRRSTRGPRPAILAGVQKCDKYLVDPGMLVVLAAAFYLLIDGDCWKTSDAFIGVGFLAILSPLFGLQHAFFTPQVRKAKELAERDLAAGDTLSDEFEAVGAADRQSRDPRRADRRRDDLLHGVQAVPIDASLPDSDVRLRGRRAHRPPRVPGLAARGGLRLPRRHRVVSLRHP